MMPEPLRATAAYWPPSFRRRGCPGLDRGPESSYPSSPYRSSHCGLVVSINLIFHARFHPLIAFSRAMAPAILSCVSYHTKPKPKWNLHGSLHLLRGFHLGSGLVGSKHSGSSSLAATVPLALDFAIFRFRLNLPGLVRSANTVVMETSQGKGVFCCTEIGQNCGRSLGSCRNSARIKLGPVPLIVQLFAARPVQEGPAPRRD